MVVDALIKTLGIPVRRLAEQAGFPPQQASALLKGSAWQRLRTWERTVGALGGRVSVHGKSGTWDVPLALVAHADLDRSYRTLARRYQAAAVAMASRASMVGVLTRTKAALADPYPKGAESVEGLAAIVQQLATRKGLLATHLTIAAGISDTAAKRFSAGDEWPALALIHGLLTALGLSVVVKAGKLTITVRDQTEAIARRTDTPSTGKKATQLKKPGAQRKRPAAAPAAISRRTSRRSQFTRDDIVRLLTEGLSQGIVAEQAGISRQRVSFIAVEAGIEGRRERYRAQNAKQGMLVLNRLRR